MRDLTPEQQARQQIDAQLQACGWTVQDFKAADLSAGRGIALREVPLTTGPCDYLLLVDRKALGVIEAKKVGTTLSTVADQSAHYASRNHLDKQIRPAVGQPGTLGGDLKVLLFPVASPAEQTLIVAAGERRLSVVEGLGSVITFILQGATRLREPILQEAFTGKPKA